MPLNSLLDPVYAARYTRTSSPSALLSTPCNTPLPAPMASPTSRPFHSHTNTISPSQKHPFPTHLSPSLPPLQHRPYVWVASLSVLLNTRSAARPLGDKTPFPNRTSKAGAVLYMDMRKGELQQKLPKFLESLHPSLRNQETPETLDFSPRPSSTRKSTRTPDSANRKFQTPLVGCE